MKLRDIIKYLIIICVVCLLGCSHKDFQYSKFQLTEVNDFDVGFANYCKLDVTTNFELNAVECSFYGDYGNSLDQASKRESETKRYGENIFLEPGDKSDIINSLEAALQNVDGEKADKDAARTMLNLLNPPNPEELFKNAHVMSAAELIVRKSKDFHFTLINEAHYNSQHRSFTKSLLQPLWSQGYRYLALETLSHDDSNLNVRGYPTKSTGYYTQESNFANLVREAMRIGFILIAYETQKGHDGSLRDRDQAENIFTKTLNIDKKGKVLIHAGYGHISESGDTNYEPMGYQLKRLINQDVLTIDQVEMIGYTDINNQSGYYNAAIGRFKFDEPVSIFDEDDRIIVDPINSRGIDIQVYHPRTKFINGRPDWRFGKGDRSIPLADILKGYDGCLLQAIKKDEEIDAIPIDQFVISEEKVFILPKGGYDLRVINCDGDLVLIGGLEVS